MNDCCGETHSARPSSSRVDAQRNHFLYLSKELRLACSGIANQENVDVSSDLSLAVKKNLSASKQLQKKTLLDRVVAVDARSQTSDEQINQVRLLRDLPKILDFLREKHRVSVNLGQRLD